MASVFGSSPLRRLCLLTFFFSVLVAFYDKPTSGAPPPTPPTPLRLSGSLDELAFVSDRDGDWDIYVSRSDGTLLRQLTHNTALDASPSWSPDGRQLVFNSDRSGYKQLYIMNATGSNVYPLLTSASIDEWPSWSPQGEWISFARVADFDGEGLRSEVFAVRADGTGLIRLTHSTGASGGANHGCYPSGWLPDGLRVVLYCYLNQNNVMFTVHVDGSPLQPLLHDGSWNAIPTVSPDGTTLTFASFRDGNYEIYRSLMAGGSVQRLTTATAEDWRPSWTRDAEQIIFESQRDGPAQLYAMNPDGTNQRPLFSHTSYNGQPAWRPVASPWLTYLPLNLHGYPPVAACAMTELEPNNTSGMALQHPPLCPNQVIAGSLPPGDSNDYYRLILDTSGAVRIELFNIPAGSDFDLYLYDANLTELATSRTNGNANEEIRVTGVSAGSYYIRVYPDPTETGGGRTYALRYSR